MVCKNIKINLIPLSLLTGGFLFTIFIKNKKMYVIVKHVRVNSSIPSKKLPVILLNSDTEVWEFETEEAAEEMKEIFQTNSDSGHVYEVKKI